MDHVTGHDHDHGHGHGHDHDHDHGHDHSLADYYKEQLLTVFVCGAFGVVGILMYRWDMLRFILAEGFRLPVLVGGILLLGLTVMRGAALWIEAGKRQHDHHDHNHAPGEVCDHPGHGHDHSHDDHEHGSVYWRMVILAFPLMLFCMGLPNRTFSKDWIDKRLGEAAAIGEVSEVAARDGDPVFDFNTLAMAAHSSDRRQALEGTPCRINGQIRKVPNKDKEFELFYMKMTCCTADSVPLQARVVVTRASVLDAVTALNIKAQDWVEVSGTIQFQYVESLRKYITVITVRDQGGIRKIDPITN